MLDISLYPSASGPNRLMPHSFLRMVPPWSLLLLVASAAALQCPDGTTCGAETLCCELPHGKGYGCCPENEVVLRSLKMITSWVSCSEGKGCPEEYSCVGTPQGGSACCPFTQGTSCQDGHHCCPSGSECSEDGHYCVPASNVSAIICPDGSSECPNDATCCQNGDQSWGCCPIIQATCCNDHLHCCPHASVCDLEHGKCVSENGELPLSKKVPARVKLLRAREYGATVKCDNTSSCPGTATCCRLPSGEWGCCPYEKAVCCDDHQHCCPNGFTCIQGSCQLEALSIPWSEKSPAITQKSNDVQCDEETSCPDKNTCCRLPSGEWGCCPYEQAVCCSDHLHCCPSGYTCDVASGSCNKPSGALKKAIPIQPLGYVWCDETYACYDGQTCCKGVGGSWTCCPYPQGVCCPDRLHCCPYGHVCLNQGVQCSRSGSLRWDLVWEELKTRL